MFVALIFWGQFFNGLPSGLNPINWINFVIFNLIYTSLPIVVVRIADQDDKASAVKLVLLHTRN